MSLMPPENGECAIVAVLNEITCMVPPPFTAFSPMENER